MDLLDDSDTQGGNAPEYSVSEISGAVKRTIESGFARVRVRGEVGRVSRPRSGHVYLDLKDDRAVLAGVVWKGQAARLATPPEEGMEVIATGRLTTFPGQSKYQIVIEHLAPAGVGALMAMLEKRRKALEAEGLFAEARKKPLPYLPEVIGVITSPSGAVIRDILHRLRERFPRRVLIWPVAVQGERCAPEVARAIAGFNALAPGGPVPRPDLLIVARGGGSIEDLWGFNEEAVVRAAAASDIPLISAVGHETDTTLIDFAADRRAPTPTAAAELAVPVRADLLAWAEGQAARLAQAVARGRRDRSQRLRDLSRALPRPQELLQGPAQRLDYAAERLPRAMSARIEAQSHRLGRAAAALRPATLLRQARHDRERVTARAGRLRTAFAGTLTARRHRLAQAASRLSLRSARAILDTGPARLSDLAERLQAAEGRLVGARTERLAGAARMLEALSYRATLARGFAVVRQGDEVVTRAEDVGTGASLDLEFADGKVPVTAMARRRGRAHGTPQGAPKAQKSLFEE